MSEYKRQIYVCPANQVQEVTRAFTISCQQVQKTIERSGLNDAPRFGDAVHNVLTAIINALNHVLSLSGKLFTWDKGYTYFNRQDYVSPESRKVYQVLGTIAESLERHVFNLFFSCIF